MKKKRILIIEDDAILRETLAEFLMEEDLDVSVASDGDAGFEMAKNNSYDLIILDIILPKKNGYEVLEELKKDEKTKGMPVIVLTNLASMNDIEKALELGANSYLVKGDYKLSEIVEKIRAVAL